MPLTTRPFAYIKELDTLIEQRDNSNVALIERAGSLLAGIALVACGVSRRSPGGGLLALLGGFFIHRGATGHCELYERLGANTARLHPERGVPDDKGIQIEKTIHVQRPADQLYRYWRRLENLPRFMPHLESVEEMDGRLSHWVVKGPAGHRVEWDAEIINEHEGEMISWQSLPGAEVQSAGSVRFEPSEGGTDLRVAMRYRPPAGRLGRAVAQVLGESPERQLEQDLARFKELIEKGEGPA